MITTFATTAEDFVAKGLKTHGWHILARNFRRRGCEIDIIALKKDLVIFVEVKARRSLNSSQAYEALITHKKINSLNFISIN